MNAEPGLDGPHWGFALDFYARPGVAEACLRLQDKGGVDVNVLLVAIYGAARLGKAVGPDEVAALDAAVAPWRDRAVLPLRWLRRDLKAGVEGAPQADAGALRENVKALELKAEQIGQSILAGTLASFAQNFGSDVGATVDAVVAFYARGAPGGDVAEAAAAIRAAAAG